MEHNTNTADAQGNGWKITGNPDCWELVCKATSPDGIEKSTKRMKVPGGYIYAVSTRIGVNAAGEALVFVPELAPDVAAALTEAKK